MTRFEVRFSRNALGDVQDVCGYIAHDSVLRAERLLEQVTAIVDSLEMYPKRGSHPRELLEVGHSEYRQVFFKPYRIIYLIEGTVVHILLFADGRGDMRTLLAQRVLGA